MNATMSLAERADAHEAKMAQELDYIIAKSRLHALAEGDFSPPPNAGAMIKANPKLRVLMGDDPRLPRMPEKPTLIDFFKLRFGPSMHLLQSARHAVKNRSEEHTSELQSLRHLVCRLLLEKKKNKK